MKTRKRFFAGISVFLILSCFATSIFAEEKYKDWTDVSNAMEEVLNEAIEIYQKGGETASEAAYNQIDIAYFKYYEKLGFEKIVMGTISGKRGTDVENQFYLSKKAARMGVEPAEFQKDVEKLIEMLHEDAKTLDSMRGESDGGEASGWGTFVSVFVLTMREGLEAILVVAAIAAYLVKTNNQKYLKSVYGGAVFGVVFSIILAVIFNVIATKLGDAQSGIQQEIFEGIAMFVAVAVLFYVSNWMLSKSEVEVWNQYIQDKVDTSLTKGNMWALAFSSFIAVAREGAELIIFFQGMRSNIANNPSFMWGGLAVSVVVLAVIYFAITKLSIRLKLKPFFTFTSALMFIMCISFTGKGVYELQEAGVIGRTVIKGMNGFTLDLLGIYDRLETLLPQLILIVITVITVAIQLKRDRKIKAELEQQAQKK